MFNQPKYNVGDDDLSVAVAKVKPEILHDTAWTAHCWAEFYFSV